MYAEDLDLCWRLGRAGWHVLYEPSATVLHESGAATAQAWPGEMTDRWQRATYAWMLWRRGRLRTSLFAAIAGTGAFVRWALLAAAARVAPGRFAARRDLAHRWASLHRDGLRSRAFLEGFR
jgi:GT2 family glycosyltransferase